MKKAKKRKILIVDDVEQNRMILSEILKEEYTVVEADDGDVCLDLLRKDKDIDLVLLDIVMPRVDGFEVLRQMSADGVLKHKSVIVTTGDKATDTEIKALTAGAVDFVEKPYNPDIVRTRVKNVIERIILENEMLEKERIEQVTKVLNELKHVSRYDSLTKIYKRATFYNVTEKLLRGKPDVRYSIVIWDIKNFKIVNELFGSDVGDKILVLIAQKLKGIVGGKGVYGRLESDKFVICIPTSMCDINSIIVEMDSMLNNSSVVDYNLKIFAGIYNITADEKIPVDQMCDRANMALKRAKSDYVNRYAYYDSEMRQTLLDEEAIINEIENAIATKQFWVSYQPIFSLKTGKPVSAEALVRWIHPQNGIVSPVKFITVLENNKFITNLDWYVLEEVCRLQKKRLDKGCRMLPVSVNFSRLDCYKPMICENVLGLVEKYGLTPDMIKIEITETVYATDKEQIVSVTKKFRDLGFDVLMDDFGSGYSSLNILKDVNVDVLKIDKKFIDDIEYSEKGAAIVSTVIHMADMLDIDVVAEGVENQYQIDLLGKIGCDKIQGYYFSKPLFEDEYCRFVDSYCGKASDEQKLDFKNKVISVD